MTEYAETDSAITAYRWYRNGDYPGDGDSRAEGEVVRRYHNPKCDSSSICKYCGYTMHEHGWLDEVSIARKIVCPGDYIIDIGWGQHKPLSQAVFEAIYQPLISWPE